MGESKDYRLLSALKDALNTEMSDSYTVYIHELNDSDFILMGDLN